MNKNEIIGIQYVGKKDVQEDTVCKTGAVWTKNQTHNFSGAIAAALLVHTDSFARAPVSMDGGTFLTSGKTKQAQHDVAAYVNLSNMGVDQMALFARRELDRVVSIDGKSVEQVRREVHSLMMNNSLDMEAQRIEQERSEDGRVPVSYMATKEEFEALREGLVVLAVVPSEVSFVQSEDAAQPAIEPSTAIEQTTDNEEVAESPATLNELLESLGKSDLIAFAKQENIVVSNAMSVERLREKLLSEITSRQTSA